jgi:hypothetical protein
MNADKIIDKLSAEIEQYGATSPQEGDKIEDL